MRGRCVQHSPAKESPAGAGVDWAPARGGPDLPQGLAHQGGIVGIYPGVAVDHQGRSLPSNGSACTRLCRLRSRARSPSADQRITAVLAAIAGASTSLWPSQAWLMTKLAYPGALELLDVVHDERLAPPPAAAGELSVSGRIRSPRPAIIALRRPLRCGPARAVPPVSATGQSGPAPGGRAMAAADIPPHSQGCGGCPLRVTSFAVAMAGAGESPPP